MFNKIVSTLAFNPSSISQLSFYAGRLRQEESVRRLGMIMIVLSMFVQVFAALAPPEKSLAASNNDVIYGGVDSLSELKKKYYARDDVRGLYNRFGLDAGDMTAGPGVQNVNFKYQEQGSRGTKTVGRVNFASTKDTVLGPYAGTNFYARSAGEWQGSESAYFFGKKKGSDGRWYFVWVIKSCGNIAYRPADAPPTPPAPPPPPTPPVTPPPATPPPTPPTTPVETPPTAPVTPPTPPPAPAPVPPAPIETPAPANISRSKSVINTTQKLTQPQTINTPARAGDVLEYTLITTNTGGTNLNDYVVEDYVGDILDYADLHMLSLTSQKAIYDPTTKKIIWPKQSIPAKGEIKNTFTVVLKSVIPSTNQPNATSTDYDCKMLNGYGNELSVPVDCSVLKTVEQLPNTGPGTTIGVAFTVSVLSGYFFMRSRLMAKEVGIVKRTYQMGY